MKILILGGGTSGFIAATTILKNLPSASVEVLYDPSRPAIGVGESTTPIFSAWCKKMGISFDELVKEIGSTVKLGIKFTNWNENETYFHPFHQFNFLDMPCEKFNVVSAVGMTNGNENGAECFADSVLESNLVALDNEGKLQGHVAYHIDGFKFSRFLEKRLENQLVVHHGRVKSVHLKDGEISSIETEDKNIGADFFIDCSGLDKVLMSKLQSSWVSKKDYCIMNSAFPIQVPNFKETPPYTEAFAHDHGWMWKIPIENRFGIGYVFNDQLTDTDVALTDFKNHLKQYHDFDLDTQSVRKISFNPGYFETQWVNNVIPLGLASGFVEPLESTNIHMIVAMSTLFSQLVNRGNNGWIRKLYNTAVSKMYEQCFDFIRLHYKTNRTNSPTWQYLDKNTPVWINDLKEHLADDFICDSDVLYDHDRSYSICIFSTPSYTRVLKGLNFLTKEGAEKFLNRHQLWEIGVDAYLYLEDLKRSSKYIKHDEYLKQIKDKG